MKVKQHYYRRFHLFAAAMLLLILLYIWKGGRGAAALIPALWAILALWGAWAFTRYRCLYLEISSEDSLTGGMNGQTFLKKWEKKLKEGNEGWSFLIINIKKFSQIDYGYGREVGDQVLKKVYEALSGVLTEEELICRASADTFYLLVKEGDSELLRKRIYALDDAVYFKEDLGIQEKLFLSIGGYVIKDPKEPLGAIMDKTNYCRTASPDAADRNTHFEIYDVNFTDRRKRERELERMGEPALEKGHFKMYLQPKYELEHETLAGAEALIRWWDPDQGMIPLYEFLPLFERNGFIRNLDRFIFESALQLIDGWIREGRKPVKISVNLSRAQFTEGGFFTSKYMPIYEKYNVPKEFLEFEISESILLDTSLITFVKELKEMGFECSMDDFGSGYSSLNTLKSLPIATVKLDRQMFSEDEKERGRIVTSGIIGIAKALGIHVVAEGIEKREDVDFLKQEGCDQIQGYYFGKPMPVEEFEQLLK